MTRDTISEGERAVDEYLATGEVDGFIATFLGDTMSQQRVEPFPAYNNPAGPFGSIPNPYPYYSWPLVQMSRSFDLAPCPGCD